MSDEDSNGVDDQQYAARSADLPGGGRLTVAYKRGSEIEAMTDAELIEKWGFDEAPRPVRHLRAVDDPGDAPT